MSPLTPEQMQSACEALGLRRSDVAAIFDYSWKNVDLWWQGLVPIPTTVSIVMSLWLHPLFPDELKPRKGQPYVLLPEDEVYFTGEQKKKPGRGSLSIPGTHGRLGSF